MSEMNEIYDIYTDIRDLVDYALNHNLIDKRDRAYTVNRVISVLRMDSYEEPLRGTKRGLCEILNSITENAKERGIIEGGITESDLFDTEIMGCMTPRPSETLRIFQEKYQASPKDATDWFYEFCQDTNYIRRDRVSKDIRWKTKTKCGELDITINLSKPEKDPKAIAAAKNEARQSGYPKCLLCPDNEGYAGRIDHPARQNLRIIPIELGGEAWGLQYSPYVYYNEHCIALNQVHVPMKIERNTFVKLLDFVTLFPHYFIGSNADLPIVGGSILSHDHFQGGNCEFAMTRARIKNEFKMSGFDSVKCGVLDWAMSVIRLESEDREELINAAYHILKKWRGYTDENAFIFAETSGEPHNTVTPVARRKDKLFELDLVLRNNITTEEHPLGVYHPHSELHHIKKENIGLIEVMGLAVLPSRLKSEFDILAKCILTGGGFENEPLVEKHRDWANEIMRKHPEINEKNIDSILKEETGLVFEQVLEHCAVFKDEASFSRFLEIL